MLGFRVGGLGFRNDISALFMSGFSLEGLGIVLLPTHTGASYCLLTYTFIFCSWSCCYYRH